MYPAEHFAIGHWLDAWESLVPFWLAIPAVLFTVWVPFDRKTPLVGWAFMITMWAAIATGIIGACWHWVWKVMDAGQVAWNWSLAKGGFRGFRPVLAAMAYANMGVTGLAHTYGAR